MSDQPGSGNEPQEEIRALLAGIGAEEARLPAEVQGKLQRAVSYLWTVEALDASGARIASSEPARFRFRP